MRTPSAVVLAAAVAAVSGCTTASSTDIKTSGLYATISATGTGDGKTAVSTTLQLGPLSTTFVELSGTDTLTASSASQSVDLKKVSFLGLVSYNGTLTGDDEGKEVTVALTRSGGDTSAPKSVGTLPAKFSLTAPAAGAKFVRGTTPLEVKWDTSGKSDAINVELSGSCIQTVSKNPSDTGSVTIPAAEILASKENETKTCDVTVTVRRTRDGTVDTAYGKGGTFRGVQQRSVVVSSTP